MRAILRITLLLLVLLLVIESAPACSLCPAGVMTTPTIREEAAQPHARLLLYGQVTESKAKPDGTGTAQFEILTTIRPDPVLGAEKEITLPRFVFVQDRKNPPRFLLFCDVHQKKLDPYRGIPIKTADVVDYVKKAMTLDRQDRPGRLRFYFDYLEHADTEIAADAFLEFAKADDRDIGEVAPKFSADKVRGWLKDPATKADRIGVYAFLLGVCGTEADASYLQTLLADPSERVRNAYDGILSGVLFKKPQEGWNVVLTGLADGRTPLALRLAMVRAVRLMFGWQPAQYRDNTLKAARAILAQGDLADMAIEDLRRWKLWDLTGEILSLYGKKGFTAPIVERAIVRYAISNKSDATAQTFVTARRKEKPDLVKDVEESLEFDK